jgi:sulfide:quinone oxidoreductase
VKRLLVLGAGTAGTMVANKLRPRLDERDWKITIVDQDETHYYQPGFLFLPFGGYRREDLVKPKRRFIPPGVELIMNTIEVVEPDKNTVKLGDGTELSYDFLIIATGTQPRPEETPGLGDDEWRKTVFDFYTIDGAEALATKLEDWEGGRLVLNIVDMPIKCPVAPLEFIFLADAFFAERGIRDAVDLRYVTPLPGAFTKPVASRYLGDMLADRKIALESDFFLEQVDTANKKLISYDEREIEYDLLVTIPINMGADYIERSGLGDELNHVPVDKHNFLSTKYDNIFALGDAAALPTSKAGSVAHFAVDIFTDNFIDYVQGRPMRGQFDGHANCFIESGRGKGMLIDFNYETEPLPGKFPLPGFGPFSLLQETEANHWGKLMFKWTYWNVLLPGKDMPIPALMSMAGKIREEA